MAFSYIVDGMKHDIRKVDVTCWASFESTTCLVFTRCSLLLLVVLETNNHFVSFYFLSSLLGFSPLRWLICSVCGFWKASSAGQVITHPSMKRDYQRKQVLQVYPVESSSTKYTRQIKKGQGCSRNLGGPSDREIYEVKEVNLIRQMPHSEPGAVSRDRCNQTSHGLCWD